MNKNLVDSSGWIEYFTESANADFFAPAIEDADHLIVASVSVLEVFKWILREHEEAAALRAVAIMQQHPVIGLDAGLAIYAAKLGLEHKLPLADSVMFGTALTFNAALWTQDSDFEGMAGVQYRRKSDVI